MALDVDVGKKVAIGESPIRAAQYVRMSTDQQRYSIGNQMQVNQAYAERRGMVIVRTYADEGRSGLNIERRDALKRLIKDAVTGDADFATILVYDVSRWGRFQDADESAHYEFICRQAGIRVEYCAEQFENDGTPVSAILKAIKRLMAGEYSRELSVKVFSAQSRAAVMGFRLGGYAGYGLRRLLVDETRVAKCILGLGEWKGIASDRIVLVPGPPEEVRVVRQMFSMFVHERMSEARIASALNVSGCVTDRGTKWNRNTVEYMLRNEKYIGNNVWNRKSFKLKKIRKRNNPEAWLRADGAFEGVVERSLFEDAQVIFRSRTKMTCTGRPRGFSNEQMLDALRCLLEKHGYISHRMIKQTDGMPSYNVYVARFGGLKNAYKQVGYDWRRRRLVLSFRRWPNEEMLKRLKCLLKERKYLSTRIIDGADDLPSASVYRSRFGSLFNAYKMIGYTAKCSKQPGRPRHLSDEEMLEGLRELLREHGHLSQDVIRACAYVPTAGAYRKRFGSLLEAYRLVGITRDCYWTRSPRPRGLPTGEMLEALRKLLRERGCLSLKLVEKCKQMPSVHQYAARFGSIMRAYAMIGYMPRPRALGGAATRSRKRSPQRNDSPK